MRDNGWNVNTNKWQIFNEFYRGLRPKDIKDKYPLKINTLYTYYEEWKQCLIQNDKAKEEEKRDYRKR